MSELTLIDPLTEREIQIVDLISRGMSNRQIAGELFLTTSTIKWYNRQIFNKLDVKSRTQAVARAREISLLDHRSDSTQTAPVAAVNNLPAQVTSFVGRDREIRESKNLLKTSRLLTFTGPAGVGKTRLALRLAQDMLEGFADGVFFIDLSSVHDPNHLSSAIAQTLNIQKNHEKPLFESLDNFIQDKQILLLLDNFEQIVESAPLAARLLASAPGLKILATSREKLGIYGEQEYPVSPLSVAKFDQLVSLEDLTQLESIQLFYQRARGIKPDFGITESNAPIIAEICVRLDGLPLAIELAAARIKMFSPKMILSRLETRLDTLSAGARDMPDRHQSLRGALDWSYELLDGAEREFFARLSVFQGGRTLEAVEEVCSPGLNIDVFDGFESLLNKNLLYLKEGPGGEPRFYMLETIHEYAREKFMAIDDVEDIRNGHARYFADFTKRAEVELKHANQELWIARLRSELANISSALSWLLSGADTTLGAQMILNIREFWLTYEDRITYEGYINDLLKWVERIIEIREDLPPDVGAGALIAAGEYEFLTGNYLDGERYSRQALALARESGDREMIALALISLGANLEAFPEKIEESISYCEEGLAFFRELGDKHKINKTLNLLGDLSRMAGNYERAKRCYEKSMEISQREGDHYRHAKTLGNLSFISMHNGNYQQAEALLSEKLPAMMKFDYKFCIILSIAQMAGPVCANGKPERAARLLSASENLLKSLEDKIFPADQFEIDRYKEAIKNQLDDETFNLAWAEGQEMSLDQAVEYALQG